MACLCVSTIMEPRLTRLLLGTSASSSEFMLQVFTFLLPPLFWSNFFVFLLNSVIVHVCCCCRLIQQIRNCRLLALSPDGRNEIGVFCFGGKTEITNSVCCTCSVRMLYYCTKLDWNKMGNKTGDLWQKFSQIGD